MSRHRLALRAAAGPAVTWSLLALLAAATLTERLGRVRLAPSVTLLAAGCFLAVVAPRLPQRSRAAAAALAAAAVAAGAGGVRVARFESGPLVELARNGGTREMRAVVIAEPQVKGDSWWTLVRVDRVGTTGTRERAFLRGQGTPPELGAVWTGDAAASPVSPDGFGAHLRDRYTTVRIHPVLWQSSSPPPGLTAFSNQVRHGIRTAAQRALPLPQAGLATGLVTGDTRLLPEEQAQALRDSGLTHLVAVSGSNVAVVGLGVALVAGLVGIGAAGRRRATIAALVWFAFLTRWEPSVLRASVMAALVLLAAIRGRLVDVRHSLAVAVLVLVLIDPGIAGAPGLLLSAAATAGVLMLAPLLQARLKALPARIAQVVATTLGAQLAVAPLLLAYAGELPLASLPANFVAVPAAALASGLAAAGSVLAAAHPVLGVPAFVLAGPPLAVVLGTAERLREWGGVVSFQRPVTLLLLVAGTTWILTRRGSRVRKVAVVVTMGTLLATVLPTLGPGGTVRGLVVTALDVGQGDALLVEAPGARILIDGGPDTRAARWLRREGKRDLDLVVLSHPHADHADGLPSVLNQSRVGAVWLPTLPSDLPSVARLQAVTAARQIPVAHPVAGTSATVVGLRLDVLAPPPGRPYRWADSEANETSTVLRASWGERVALLTGDVERAAQHDLLASPERLRAGLLKIPHHGGATSDPKFLLAVHAQIAVVSVGRDNSYGHPRREVLDLFEHGGARVRRTDREGTLRIEVPASNAEMAPSPHDHALVARSPTHTAAGRSSRGRDSGRMQRASAASLRSHGHDRPCSCLPRHRRRRAAAPARARAPPRRPPCCRAATRGCSGRCRGRRAAA